MGLPEREERKQGVQTEAAPAPRMTNPNMGFVFANPNSLKLQAFFKASMDNASNGELEVMSEKEWLQTKPLKGTMMAVTGLPFKIWKTFSFARRRGRVLKPPPAPLPTADRQSKRRLAIMWKPPGPLQLVDRKLTVGDTLSLCFLDMIHPLSRFHFYWAVFLLVFVVWAALVTPYVTCFSVNMHISTTVGSLEFILDVVCVLDMYLSCRTAYVDDHYKLQSDRRKVLLHYLCSSFPVDVLAAIPFGTVINLHVSWTQHNPYRLVRMLKLLKVMQYIMNAKLAAHLNNTISGSMLRLIVLAAVAIVVIHISACWFFYIGDVLHQEGWKTWLHANDMLGKPRYDIYLVSLYWSMYTVGTIGYGNIVIVNNMEKVTCTIVMLLGVTMMTYSMGSVTTLISALNAHNARIVEHKQLVADFIKTNKLSRAVATRLKNFYNYVLEKQVLQDEHEIIAGLSESLRREVVIKLYWGMIDKVPFFRNKHPQFITQVVTSLKVHFYSAGDTVVLEGDPGTEMFFVAEGTLEVRQWSDTTQTLLSSTSTRLYNTTDAVSQALEHTRSYKVLTTLTAGQHFGEYSCLTGAVRSASVVATSFCELYALQRTDLEKIISMYPELAGEFQVFQKISQAAKGDDDPNDEDHPFRIFQRMTSQMAKGEDDDSSEEECSNTHPDSTHSSADRVPSPAPPASVEAAVHGQVPDAAPRNPTDEDKHSKQQEITSPKAKPSPVPDLPPVWVPGQSRVKPRRRSSHLSTPQLTEAEVQQQLASIAEALESAGRLTPQASLSSKSLEYVEHDQGIIRQVSYLPNVIENDTGKNQLTVHIGSNPRYSTGRLGFPGSPSVMASPMSPTASSLLRQRSADPGMGTGPAPATPGALGTTQQHKWRADSPDGQHPGMRVDDVNEVPEAGQGGAGDVEQKCRASQDGVASSDVPRRRSSFLDMVKQVARSKVAGSAQ